MINRRHFSQAFAAGVMASMLPVSWSAHSELKLPTVGMGTWITFDVQPSATTLADRTAILAAFFAAGGRFIDSSPMYGQAQKNLGMTLPKVKGAEHLFSATKVWTLGRDAGIKQMQASMKLWGLESMDLMFVHNLLDWQAHLPTLNAWKSEGLIRHTGITISHGRRHAELVAFLKNNPVDFVQFSYNIHNREAERRLLPLAQDLGMKVVINRPFQTGGLFTRVRNKPLPAWASEVGVNSWAQYFLKFIIAHPAVTCTIPATSQLAHMQDNMQALKGPMPDQKIRQEMVRYYESVI